MGNYNLHVMKSQEWGCETLQLSCHLLAKVGGGGHGNLFLKTESEDNLWFYLLLSLAFFTIVHFCLPKTTFGATFVFNVLNLVLLFYIYLLLYMALRCILVLKLLKYTKMNTCMNAHTKTTFAHIHRFTHTDLPASSCKQKQLCMVVFSTCLQYQT